MSTDAATPHALPDESTLPDDPETLKGMIRELLAMLHNRDQELSGVRQRLDQLLRRLYGPKGEHFRPDQPVLFDGAAEPASPTPNSPAPAEATPVTRIRSGHGRRKLPANLPRERVVHDIPDAEKTCPCCASPRAKIGEETSEQLDYRPANLFVVEHVRLKYACPKCLKTSSESPAASSDTPSSPIAVAAKPAQPIDKGLPGPGLLAHVIMSKYSDHLPLHRQEAMLARQGVELSRSTLADWMAAAANVLKPLYKLMLTQVLLGRVVQTDETRVPVLDPGRKQTKPGRLWVFVGDRDHPYTVYDYTATKARDGPAQVLKDYRGFLQADAANVFDGIYRPGAIVEVGCWAHARRYFHEARDTDAARSAEALTRIRDFYRVEDDARDLITRQQLAGDAADALRLRLRQERTTPKLAAFAAWLDDQAPRVLPKSPIGQAIAYARRQWPALTRFTEHGFLNIDNNASERALRAIAIGRKNWLFAGSDSGGRTAAVLYTMTQTCRRHGLDPFAYLRDVLTRLPNATSDDVTPFLPDRWLTPSR
ncbi:MAG TPA: IS66 family transposase [Gemmataceae bacterium]|nr:IS66 family transposase [Gemmataceae bacterium]